LDTIFLGGYDGAILKTFNGGGNTLIKYDNKNFSSDYHLFQNYPNPFNPSTKIKFDICNPPFIKGGQGAFTTLKVYDITGREIQTLVNEPLQPGTYEVTFDGTNLASGIYFYQLKAGEYIETKKLVLLK